MPIKNISSTLKKTNKMVHVFLTLILLIVTQSCNAAPAVDQPTFEPGVLYLPDKAIALGMYIKC